ncbi:MAG: beta-lactamase [Gemmatimonadetes bacterium]|nr:beta-lactamase [Gemmatimonadota bacterium]
MQRTILLTSLFAFGLAPHLHAQQLMATIDSMMVRYAKPNGPGASLLVIHDGHVIVAKGYGLADVEQKIPVDKESNFRLASLSKQFTATAIMLLAADGKLHYEDDITSVVAGLPAYARGVTIRHLLNHTGGLSGYESFVPDSQTTQVHDADVPALISHASAPKFSPGTKYDYSNTGYALLALAVEHSSGKRYADFLHDRIFAPLGMTGTLAFENGRSVVPHRAYGYRVDTAGNVRRTDQSNTSATLGDGGIYSNAADLAKWDQAIERHTLVDATSQQRAWTPPVLANGRTSEYGFGWFVDDDHGTMRVRHHGESRGFTNGIIRYPERRLTVVILTNRSGGAPWDTAQRIAELYLGPSAAGGSPAWRP